MRQDRARAFVSSLRTAYALPPARVLPAFAEMSYAEAVQEAERRCRPLLVYLHSPLHEDAGRFVTETLSSPAFVDFVTPRFVVWGGSTATAEGFEACSKFGAASFPFVGVYTPARGSTATNPKTQRVWSTGGGFVAPGALVHSLSASCGEALTSMEVMAAEREARDNERRLREEQEADYAVAEAEDLRRTAEAEAAERAAREQAARAAAEEARAAEASELAAAIELSKELHRESDLAAAQRRLTDHPEPSAEEKADVCTVRFTLPNGTRFQRKFRTADTIGVVRDVVMVTTAEMGTPLHHFDLSSQYPRRSFPTDSDHTVTLKSIGFSTQVGVCVGGGGRGK